MGDQPVARPLPTQRTTQPQKKTHTDIYDSSEIPTQDPSLQASGTVHALYHAATVIDTCIIRLVKSRIMRRVGYVARMVES
jgi:hypothetical protein